MSRWKEKQDKRLLWWHPQLQPSSKYCKHIGEKQARAGSILTIFLPLFFFFWVPDSFKVKFWSCSGSHFHPPCAGIAPHLLPFSSVIFNHSLPIGSKFSFPLSSNCAGLIFFKKSDITKQILLFILIQYTFISFSSITKFLVFQLSYHPFSFVCPNHQPCSLKFGNPISIIFIPMKLYS